MPFCRTNPVRTLTRFPVFPIKHSCLCLGLTIYLIHSALPPEFRIYISSLKCWLHIQPISPSYCVNTQVFRLISWERELSRTNLISFGSDLTYEGVISLLVGVKIQFRYLQKESLYEINYAGETEDICYLKTLLWMVEPGTARFVVAAD